MTDTEMSSEEKQDLAQEALDAAEQTSAAEKSAEKPTEPKVGLHTVTALRTRAQRAEISEARALGKLEAMEQAQAQQAPAVKSPLDLEIARQAAEGIAEADMTISPAVVRAQELHNKQIANQEAATKAANELAVAQQTSKAKAIAKHEDWQAIINAGQGFLSAGELLDLNNAGVDFGEKAYAKCIEVIECNKPEPEKPETAPKKKPDEPEADEKVLSQEELLAEVGGDPDAVRASQL